MTDPGVLFLGGLIGFVAFTARFVWIAINDDRRLVREAQSALSALRTPWTLRISDAELANLVNSAQQSFLGQMNQMNAWGQAYGAQAQQMQVLYGQANSLASQSIAPQNMSLTQMQRLLLTPQTPAPVPPPILEKSEQAECIVAWRLWYFRKVGSKGLLESVVADELWPMGEPCEAKGVHVTEHKGIHAWKTRNAALRYADEARAHKPGRTLVLGSVAMWGTVIEFEHGYRSQFAYPQHFYVAARDENCKAMANALAQTYGVEVTR